MAEQARQSPYPADTRAKGWRFEIDMEKARQSDTWALTLQRGWEPKALLVWMWSVAWEQTPCGSLPNDEELIAARLELPTKVWAKHRAILMRNWWLADDGRLYHDIIVTRVLAMLAKRASDAERAANRRARKAESGDSHADITDESRVTHAGVNHEFDTKHQAPTTSLREEKKPKAEPWVPLADLVADGLSEEVAASWLAHRRTRKAKLTALAWEGFKREVAKAPGWGLEAAVLKAITRNWTAFDVAWVNGETRGSPNRKSRQLETAGLMTGAGKQQTMETIDVTPRLIAS